MNGINWSTVLSCGPSQVIGMTGLAFSLVEVVARSVWQLYARFSLDQKSPDYCVLKQKVNRSYIRQMKHVYNLAKGYFKMLMPVNGWSSGIESSKFIRTIGYRIGSLPIVDYFIKKHAESHLYINSQKMRNNVFRDRFNELQAKPVELKRSDDGKIDALWIQGNQSESGPTMVIFHGNINVLDDFFDYAKFFKEQGLNILMITMGGYHNSAFHIPTSEKTTKKDAEACIKYLTEEKKVPEEKIVAFGQSIGGTLALKATEKYPNIHVITDQTLTKASDVAANEVLKIESEHKKLLASFAKGLCQGAYKEPKGLNNKNLVRKMKGNFFAVSVKGDHLMTAHAEATNELMKTKPGQNFSETLAEAYLKTHPQSQKEVHHSFDGHHGWFFIHNMEAKNHVVRFLKEAGLIH